MAICRTMRLSSGFTYWIGTSLYVPLTSRCNSLTLPATRGSSFKLADDIVASLCRVRQAEGYSDDGISPPLEPIAQIEQEQDRRPTKQELLDEIKPLLSSATSIVLAGEGEPTLRRETLYQLSQSLKQQSSLPIRVVTNGLLSFPLQYVDSVSVALMTHDPLQYDKLMKPVSSTGTSVACAHEQVCSFIQEAVQSGLSVEATAVERPEVDKEKTLALALELGVKLRWRPYFP
jgi:TatD family-associated radical SAM protein